MALTGRPRGVLAWVAVCAATTALSLVLISLGLAAATILGGMIAAAAVALLHKQPLRLPPLALRVALALLGVNVGASIHASSLSAIADNWGEVLTVVLATIVTCALGGVLLSRLTGLDTATSQLGMVAGGAAGIVAMSDDVGADGRLVAMVQYLRVYLVFLLLPLVVALSPLVETMPFTEVDPTAASVMVGLTAAAVGFAANEAIRRAFPIPAGALLFPMLAGGAAAIVGPDGSVSVPIVVNHIALAVIGINVGLQFTVESLRKARQILAAVLAVLVLVIVACAALGLALSAVTGRTVLDGYLATTPGGLVAVLAIVAEGHADAAFVTAIQVARLLAMLLIGPALGYWFSRRLAVSDD